jgi:urease accessory protein
MLNPSALLQLIWLASPALPVGGFSYSEALEPAVEAGLVTNELQARDWLRDQLALSLGRGDLAVVAQAFDAWQRHDAPRIEVLNTWVRETRESRELRQQTEQMGRSLVEWLRHAEAAATAPATVAAASVAVDVDVDATAAAVIAVDGGANANAGQPADAATHDPRVEQLAALKPAPTWPVAFALAAARSGAPMREALLAHAFGWAENMVQAAMKTVPLGQAAGQRILAALAADIPGVVETARACSDDARQVYTPMLAILSAQHETQYSRLFRS